ncbi:hypothetical protein COO60DRAFT_1497299, partial [Scenedesmus sp. NREL 46B-D3]
MQALLWRCVEQYRGMLCFTITSFHAYAQCTPYYLFWHDSLCLLRDACCLHLHSRIMRSRCTLINTRRCPMMLCAVPVLLRASVLYMVCCRLRRILTQFCYARLDHLLSSQVSSTLTHQQKLSTLIAV